MACLATASPTFSGTAPWICHADYNGTPCSEWAVLPSISAELSQALAADRGDGRLLQIGLSRPLTKPLSLSTVAPGRWTVHTNAWRSYAYGLVAAGAIGVRVHLQSVSLPAGSRVLVYDPANPEISVRAVTRQDLDEQSSVWSPTVFAERIAVEVQVPPEVPLEQVQLAINEISHLYNTGSGGPRKLEGPCHQDVSCYPAFAQESKGVARITFIENGSTLVCSGALLKGASRSDAYFLTAHHCVRDQSTASTIEFFWFYQTDSCNGPPPDVASVPVTTGGAALLATSEASDFTLLRLRRSPPSGAAPLDWTLEPPQVGETVVSIHHPDGSFKRLSTGRVVGVDPDFTGVQWISGATEDGSSGGPLLNSRGQVLGQLDSGYHGPGSSCANPGSPDQFGRFDITYQSIAKWLSKNASSGFPALNATYNGLVYPADGVTSTESAGYFTIRTTSNGKLSGKLVLGSAKVSFSGAFDENGYANLTGRTRGSGLNIELQLDPSNLDHLAGTVSGDSFASQLLGDRAVFDMRQARAPQAGKYTVVLPGDPDASDRPGGDSFGTVFVDAAGRIRFSGVLADGTKASQSAALSPNAQWPLYVPLYGGHGLLIGWIDFTDANGADLSGQTTWLKGGGATSSAYSEGFHVEDWLVGSSYTPPRGGSRILDGDETVVQLQGAGEEIWNPVSIDERNRVIDQGENKLRLSFSPSTGTFSGTIRDPASSRVIRLIGVVLQRFNDGHGFFLIPGAGSGRVVIGQ